MGTIIIAFALGTSCNWTPRVETVLHQSPEGTVSFRTISDPAFQADHPVDLSPALIEKVLRGISVQKEPRLLQRLLSGRRDPIPVFSPKQVAFLAPLIADALSKATPEEEIFFDLDGREEHGAHIEGTVLVRQPAIILRWKIPLSSGKPSHITKNTVPSTTLATTIQFSPREALMESTRLPAPDFLSESEYQTLVINYKALDRSRADEQPRSADHERIAPTLHGQAQNEPLGSSSTESFKKPSRIKKPPSFEQQETDRTNRQDVTVEKLRAEIEALKRALAEQRAVLEQLTGSEP
ncbi:MAG: hypothetical protein D6690_17620 [Nitrospirae bacterium]|nr:MAG: hypothetical protein D6690_17620 [Nitrospirota bacterium]